MSKHQSKTKSWWFILSLAALLNACGGGGDTSPSNASLGSNNQNSPLSAGVAGSGTTGSAATVTLDFKSPDAGISGCTSPESAMTFSPERGFEFDEAAHETELLALLNHLRCLANLPALQRIDPLDLAAKSHANYSVINNAVVHNQVSGLPGFTAVLPGQRMGIAGFRANANADQPLTWGEVVAKTGTSAREAHEGLTAAIYHRFVMISPQFDKVGIGMKLGSRNRDLITVADLASNEVIRSNRLIAYPANGQINVPVAFNTDYETPDPLAGKSFVGYPVSVQTDRGTKLKIRSFSIRKAGSDTSLRSYVRGTAVDASTIGVTSDPNLDSHTAFLMTHDMLEANTHYIVDFQGVTEDSAGIQTPRRLSWTFKTRPELPVAQAETSQPKVGQYFRVRLNGCGSTYSWRFTGGIEVELHSNHWMQVKPTRAGTTWLEVTDTCGKTQRLDFTAIN